MKHKLAFFGFALSLAFTIGSFQPILACSCLKTSPCQSFGYADAVFVGKVIGSKYQKTIEDYSETDDNSNTAAPAKPKKVTYDVGEIYFEVSEAFSGAEKGARITIHSGTGGGDCGYWFKRGETYLVYASREISDASSAISSSTGGQNAPELKPNPQRLWTSICSGTKPSVYAEEDLKYLKSFSPGENSAMIFGGVGELLTYRKDEAIKPLKNIRIRFQTIGKPEKFYETTADADGKYEIKLPAERYEIVPVLPDYAEVKEESERLRIEVKANACANVDFTVQNKSRISGKLLTDDGKPIFDSTVELIEVNTGDWAASDDTDEKGEFSLEGIAAGKYFIAVNRKMSPHAGSPYPTFYYPNSPTPEKAQIFTVGLGQNFNDLLFRLPPKLQEQTISGKVVWEDGKPAAETRVEIDDTNDDSFFRPERVTKTDANGNFSLKGFIGRSYTLQAKFEKYRDLTEAQAKRKASLTGRITTIAGVNAPPRYVEVTRGVAKIEAFKVGDKPITFRIVLKKES